jgi:alpha-L-fucosidase 2
MVVEPRPLTPGHWGTMIFMSRGWVARALIVSLLPLCARAEATSGGSIAARASISIGQPNILPTQAMGLGNGKLGAAFWSAQGLTLQLNRADTLPQRRSPGQVTFPDLGMMIADRGFRGMLNLEDGVLEENGGGVALKAWVDHDADRVIVDVRGLTPQMPQHIRLGLWEPRKPVASAHGDTAVLAEAWLDDTQPGASGRRFGSLAAIRVIGRDVHALVIDERTVEVTALPTADGHLQVVIAAPAYDGGKPAMQVAGEAFAPEIRPEATVRRWHAFWSRVQPVRAESRDGIARYAETLRTLFLFASAAHNGDVIPGSQGGMADLFSSARDDHFWDPAAFWFWNLRMQVAANLAAGVPELNAPVFALYRNNLDAIRRWTFGHMSGRPGACIPETMRFNGNGVEFENDRFRPFAIITHSCDEHWSASSNARTLTSGAEIGLWVWRSYLQTGDREFLQANFPLMVEPARFLLGYQKMGKDGLLHTAPSNSHETQMDVTDPTSDLAAIRALYPAVIDASRVLGQESEWTTRLQAALAQTPALPVVAASSVASPDPLARPYDRVLAASYEPAAKYVNGENVGLEPVWPYGLIGIDDPLFAIAKRTYELRPFQHMATWSNDPIQAARLGLGSEMAQAIFQLAQLYQVYPNGMSALLSDPPQEFYIEQAAVISVALSEALAVQESGGLIQVAPAIPPGWTIAGTVPLRANASIDVEAIDGKLTAFAVRGGNGSSLRFVTPWKGQVQVMQDGKPLRIIEGGRFSIDAAPGKLYRVAPVGGVLAPSFAGNTEPSVKTLGRAAIGLGPPCCAAPPGYDPQNDRAKSQ